MKRQFCKVKHDPENGTYGDCLRACIATILGHDVPHFFDDGCDGETGHRRMRDYLKTFNTTCLMFSLPGHFSKDDLFDFMSKQNPETPYVLFCKCGQENHAVVCVGGEVVHNPAWTPYPVSGPTSDDLWVVMSLVNKIDLC